MPAAGRKVGVASIVGASLLTVGVLVALGPSEGEDLEVVTVAAPAPPGDTLAEPLSSTVLLPRAELDALAASGRLDLDAGRAKDVIVPPTTAAPAPEVDAEVATAPPTTSAPRSTAPTTTPTSAAPTTAPPTTAPPTTAPPTTAPPTTTPPPTTAPSMGALDAIAAWFPGSLYDPAVRVARCESSLNPSAVSRGGGNHGLFQINNVHQSAFTRVTGQPWSAVYSAYYNAQFARYLYNQSGWQPWACRP